MDTWQVKGSSEVPAKKSDLGVEIAVRVTMEPTEVEGLKRIDFLPYCGGFRAYCLVLKDKEEVKDGGNTDNMEVDTPASDKEESQDRDGGPSDNKERPTTPKKDNLTDLWQDGSS